MKKSHTNVPGGYLFFIRFLHTIKLPLCIFNFFRIIFINSFILGWDSFIIFALYPREVCTDVNFLIYATAESMRKNYERCLCLRSSFQRFLKVGTYWLNPPLNDKLFNLCIVIYRFAILFFKKIWTNHFTFQLISVYKIVDCF